MNKPIKLVCPECSYEIPDELIDLHHETALCPSCQKDFVCRDWIQNSLVTPETLREPPDGAGFQKMDGGFRVWVSRRSYTWISILPAAVFCSYAFGFISWKVFFHSVNGWDQLGVFVFLTPFYLITVCLWVATVMSVGGKIEVSVHGNDGTIFEGCGPIGWKRRLEWDQIEKIGVANVYAKNRRTRQKISIEGEKIISFGTGLKASRLRFLFAALRLMHKNKSA